MDNVEYCETAGMSKFFKTVCIVSTIWFICVYSLDFMYNWAYMSILGVVGRILPVVFVYLVFFVLCGRFKITITSKELVVDYGFFIHKRIALCDIESCEKTKTSLGKYGGAGIRYGTDGSVAYSTSFGAAVKVNVSGKRPFVFSTNHPDTVYQIISAKIKSLEP